MSAPPPPPAAPTIGRIVHFETQGLTSSGVVSPITVPAIVTGVWGDGSIALTAFAPGSPPIAYDRVWPFGHVHQGDGGGWKWPPR